MTFSLSLFALCSGVTLAAGSMHRSKHRNAYEALAGTMVVIGLGLLGICLPIFR